MAKREKLREELAAAKRDQVAYEKKHAKGIVRAKSDLNAASLAIGAARRTRREVEADVGRRMGFFVDDQDGLNQDFLMAVYAATDIEPHEIGEREVAQLVYAARGYARDAIEKHPESVRANSAEDNATKRLDDVTARYSGRWFRGHWQYNGVLGGLHEIQARIVRIENEICRLEEKGAMQRLSVAPPKRTKRAREAMRKAELIRFGKLAVPGYPRADVERC